MKTKNYWWLIFRESDINLYQNAFLRTPSMRLKDPKKDPYEKWTIDSLPELIHTTTFGEYEICPLLKTIEFKDELAKILTKYCYLANNMAAKIKDKKQNYFEKEKGCVKGAIFSLVQKWDYEDDKTVIKIAADLMWDIAIKHKFSDGNKRTALITTLFFLQLCGLYVLKTIDDNFWDDFMSRFVEEHEKELKTEEEQKKEIQQIIMMNIALSYTWH